MTTSPTPREVIMKKLSDYKVTVLATLGVIGFGIGAYFEPLVAIGAAGSFITGIAELCVRKRRDRAGSPPVVPESPVIPPVIHPDPNTIVNVIVDTHASRYEGNPNRAFLESLDNAANEIIAHSKQPSTQYRRDSFVTYQYSEKRLLRHSGHLTAEDLKEFHDSLERIKAEKASNIAVVLESPKSGGPEV
jgi:hypothetical protein